MDGWWVGMAAFADLELDNRALPFWPPRLVLELKLGHKSLLLALLGIGLRPLNMLGECSTTRLDRHVEEISPRAKADPGPQCQALRWFLMMPPST